MATKIYFRNPKLYIKELIAAGSLFTSWDEGWCKKWRIDPQKYLSLYYPESMNWETMVVGWSGAQIFDSAHGASKPREVHHVMSMEKNKASMDDFFSRLEIENYERMLVVTDIPNTRDEVGKKVIRDLAMKIEEHPDARIMLHGLYGYGPMFSYQWEAVDVDARIVARKGKIKLPTGQEVDPRKTDMSQHMKWIHLMGMSLPDLTDPRNRCIYNIHSAEWAGRYWNENFAFKSRRHRVNFEVSDSDFEPVETSRYKRPRHTFDEYDKLLCNTCSVQNSCKFFRLGAVCSVPGAEPAKLAEMFKTRDADRIINGLGTVLAAQANRAEQAMEDEAATGELSPEVTKILNSLFSNGVKLAKLVNPDLNGRGVNVGIQVNGATSAAIAASHSASQLTASVVATLEAKGISRDEITPNMVATILDEISSEQELLVLDAPAREE